MNNYALVMGVPDSDGGTLHKVLGWFNSYGAALTAAKEEADDPEFEDAEFAIYSKYTVI